jgi:hypothetical protein
VKTPKKGGLPSVEPTTLREAVEKENAKIDDKKVLFEMGHVLYSRAKGIKIVSSSLKVQTTVCNTSVLHHRETNTRALEQTHTRIVLMFSTLLITTGVLQCAYIFQQHNHINNPK